MNRIIAKRRGRSWLEAMITTSVLTFVVPCAMAQTETWNGGSGDWNVGTNWTPMGVPNGSTFDVVITGSSGTPSSVTLDNLSPVIQNLSLDSFSTLSIISGQSLFVTGPSITNAGQVNVGNATLYADINGGTVTLSGGGAVNLTDPSTKSEATTATRPSSTRTTRLRARATSTRCARSRTRAS